MKKSGLAAAVALLILLPFFAVQACGPDFRPDVFVRSLRPDHPKEFAAGKLGVLLPTYPRMDLIVAFRYLNGGKLSTVEQAAYQPTYSEFEPDSDREDAPVAMADSKPASLWTSERSKFIAGGGDISQFRNLEEKTSNGYTFQDSYLNCNDDAFKTAIRTLQARAQAWGQKSPWLADWIQGQDAVFANCAGSSIVMPAAAPANAPALLYADRAYQTASSSFHAGKFEEARAAYAAIHRDGSSPWQGIAGYLEARCLVRQAYLTPPVNRAGDFWHGFDPAPMEEAAALLRKLLLEKHDGISEAAIEGQLGYIAYRVEPIQRAHELAKLLAGPATDPQYNQNLIDLTMLLNAKLDSIAFRQDAANDLFLSEAQKKISLDTKASDAQRAAGFSGTYADTRPLRTDAPLIDWALTMQSPAAEAREHALAAWRHSPTLYWLVAALTKARGDDAEAQSLIAAAEKTPAGSPAWATVTYHRARLLLESGKAAEAQSVLDQALPILIKAQQDSVLNLYQDLKMAAAPDLDGFLRLAPKKVLLRTSESYYASKECQEAMKNPKRSYDCAKTLDADQFSDAAAGFFNTQAPLSVLVDTAKSNAVPPQLRRSVAMMAWTRSILLHDDAAAKALLPELPAKLQQQAGDGTGFAAIMTLARNPGLRPYLESGIQRSYTYDFVESYRDNWWCSGFAPGWAASKAPFASETPAFLTLEQRNMARDQFAKLSTQERAEFFLGDIILAYAKDHADDPKTPEALYLLLRMIRYGCEVNAYAPDGKPTPEELKEAATKKEASRLLRQRYAASPWTKKAAPFAG